MGRNRKRKYPISQNSKVEEANAIPIPNLPKNYLTIKLRNKKVKMKNLLTFAFDKCKNQEGVLWTATGDDIEKLISYVEIFKRTNEEFKNQINKLRYTQMEIKKNDSAELKKVPEIFIYVFKDTDSEKLMPGKSELSSEDTSSSLTNETVKSLAELNLKLGQKRSIADNPSNTRKGKKKRKSNSDEK